MSKAGKRQFLSAASLGRLSPLATRLLRSPRLFRSLAARARRRGDLAADAFYRRNACRIEPARGSNWVQLGHALKDLGFFGQAEEAYTHGLALQPDSADIHLQLAHLAKMRGIFDDAERHFVAARDLGHPGGEGIERELALLARIDNSSVYPGKIAGLIEDGAHIFVSAPVASIQDNDRTSLTSGLGRVDYSYAFAMRGFVRALEQLEYNFTIVPNPEFVADIRERSNARVNIHIGFYPPERLRLLKGAYNINCFAWEFDRLRKPGEVLNYHAFSDQATMLNLVDELWVPSRHGAEAVARDVTTPVYAVPSPVLGDLRPAPRDEQPQAARVRHLAQGVRQVQWQPLAVFARLQAAMNDKAARRQATLPDILQRIDPDKAPLIFLTILNVHDFRKQLHPMLQGFLEFQMNHPDAYLLVKMTTPDRGKLAINTFLLMDQISNAGELPRPLVSDHVWITDQVLPRDEMNRLIDMSAFYVCTSYAEGQNLPLLEAMGRGIVPVSVDNTAMADYIMPETAVPIRSEPRPLGPRLASRYGMYGLETNFVEGADVRRAFEQAAALTAEDYAARSAAALALVERDYGVGPVAEALERIVGTIRAGLKDA